LKRNFVTQPQAGEKDRLKNVLLFM